VNSPIPVTPRSCEYPGSEMDAMDLDAFRDDLTSVVRQTLEPAQVSVWLNEHA
jgi:hypothetical protein